MLAIQILLSFSDLHKYLIFYLTHRYFICVSIFQHSLFYWKLRLQQCIKPYLVRTNKFVSLWKLWYIILLTNMTVAGRRYALHGNHNDRPEVQCFPSNALVALYTCQHDYYHAIHITGSPLTSLAVYIIQWADALLIAGTVPIRVSVPVEILQGSTHLVKLIFW